MKIYAKKASLGLAFACTVPMFLAGCGNREQAAVAPTAAPMAPSASTVSAPAGTTVGTEIDDSVVTTKVKAALLADPEAKSFEIKVETRKGQVQLSGFVDSRAHMDNAIAIARTVQGVQGVEDAMSLKDGKASIGNTVDDGIVTAKVKSALLADAGVKGLDVAVVTRKGEVQLSGYVDNQAQIDRAAAIARGVEGVQRVDNEMSIKK